MRLSIIVPVLNEEKIIVAALEALQGLRHEGHEVIVADGGSDDATRDLAAPLADWVLTAPRGRARQMNAGAAAAVGDVLLFLHGDTRLPENAAPVIRTAMEQHQWGRFDVRIQGRPRMLGLVARLMNLRSRLSGIATGDQAIFVRTAHFRALGGYPDQALMEDIELSRRLKRIGPPACLGEPVVTSGRRWEENGVWQTILLMWRLRLLYWLGVPAERLAPCYHSKEKHPGHPA